MSDPFRSVYKEHGPQVLADMAKVKELAGELYELIGPYGAQEPRMIALAKTKLEESVMWAVKGITA